MRGDVINVNADIGERISYFEEERGEVTFFCKDCKKITEAKREEENSYVFVCPFCGGKNVALGTEAGLKEHYQREKP